MKIIHGLAYIVIPCLGFALPSFNSASDQPSSKRDTSQDIEPVVALFELLIASGADQAAQQSLSLLTEKVQTGTLSAAQLAQLRPRLKKSLDQILSGNPDGPLYLDAALLATSWKDANAVKITRQIFESNKQSDDNRTRALDALISAGDTSFLKTAGDLLARPKENSALLRSSILASLGRVKDQAVADVVLASYEKLGPQLQPKAIELLTQRTTWSRSLLFAIAQKKIPSAALNVNQVRKLLAGGDSQIARQVKKTWGSLRTERDPQRELVIAQMRRLIQSTPGDARRGHVVFRRVCGQCHKLYGEGADVGPDITNNGRGSFTQLLSNVFDPSLVIGASYQAVTLRTEDGRVLTGLPIEDNDRRIVLKLQGGKQEIIARDEIEEIRVSKLSMMPEALEEQLKPQEIVDLFALLMLDRPPDDPKAKRLPGAPRAQ